MITSKANRTTIRSGRIMNNRSGWIRIGAYSLLLSFALAGCKQAAMGTHTNLDGYRTRHPIVLKEEAVTLDVPVGLTTSKLNRVQNDQIAGFSRESRHKGDGIVDILVPSGSANESTANHMASKIRRIVTAQGGARAHIRAYSVNDPKAVAPIRLSYVSVKASVHQCGRWPDNIAANFNRTDSYWEYGCATQSNLAAMISNPSDLIHPRTMTPADQVRRGTVLDKYRQGEATGSAKEESDASISEIGG